MYVSIQEWVKHLHVILYWFSCSLWSGQDWRLYLPRGPKHSRMWIWFWRLLQSIQFFTNSLPCFNWSTIFAMYNFHFHSLSSKFALIFSFQTFNFSDCSNTEEIGDGVCNDENNNYICNFDAGDCCDPNAVLLFCYDCTCVWERTTYPVLTTRYSSTYLF